MIRLVSSIGSVHRVASQSSPRRKYGVPPGGPFDSEAARLANALVGQPSDAPIWELALATATYVAESDGFVAAVGANASLTVGTSAGTTNSVRRVRTGESVVIGIPTAGCRVYFQWSRVGREGRIEYNPVSQTHVDVVAGPDADLFRAGWPDTVKLSTLMNRVGIRALADDQLIHNHKLPSKPQVIGSGQVTPRGELIIIGPDGPVTGGYPQILTVARASMAKVAQLTPGQTICLRPISIEDARELWQSKEATLMARLNEIGAGLATS